MPDIFISFMHRDNLRQAHENQGWVDLFSDALQTRIDALGGRKFDIFRDQRSLADSALTPVLEEAVSNSRVLITIISPSYVRSPWCRKEVDLFCDAAKKTGDLNVGTSSRIIQVVKLPVDHSLVKSMRVELAETTGYQFFKEAKDGAPHELDPRLDRDDRIEFLERINSIAHDLYQLLSEMESKPAAVPDREPVYAAEPIRNAPGETRHDVFICHSGKDEVLAVAACTKLEAHGIRCWMAPRDVGPGRPYSSEIVEAIEQTQLLLLIFSSHSNTSRDVLNEIDIASNREILIVPFRIDDVPVNKALEYYIRKLHWLDALTPPMEARIDELAARIKRLLERAPRKQPFPVEP